MPNWESGGLLVKIRAGSLATVAKGLSQLQRWPRFGIHSCDLGVRPHPCGLGAGLNTAHRSLSNQNVKTKAKTLSQLDNDEHLLLKVVLGEEGDEGRGLVLG